MCPLCRGTGLLLNAVTIRIRIRWFWGALGSGQDCTVLTENIKYSLVHYPLTSMSLLTACSLLTLSMKTSQIPFSKLTRSSVPAELASTWAAQMDKYHCTSLMPMCAKEKSASTFPAGAAFPGGRGTPCCYPLFSLTTESSCQRGGGRAERGWLQGGLGKPPVIARPVPCWRKKGRWLIKPGMASSAKVTKGHFPGSQPRACKVWRGSCMSKQRRWKCSSLWIHVESQSPGDDQWLWRSEVL